MGLCCKQDSTLVYRELTMAQRPVEFPEKMVPKSVTDEPGNPQERSTQARFAESGQVPVKFRFALQVLNSLGVVMAQQCDICGKKPQAGNRISHAHNVTKRRWNVNLRPVHAKVAGQGKRMRVCTSCLRSGKVVKA
jgi:large subunit ribosomal protein L28